MNSLFLFVFLVLCLLAVDAGARHRSRPHSTKRSMMDAKRAINYDALEKQQHFYSCMEKEGVEGLQKYLAVRYDPKKTKGAIARYHYEALMKLTGSNIQEAVTCAYTYEREETVRNNDIEELRRSDRSGLNGAARSAFDQITKILDNQSITLAAERKAVAAIYGRLNSKDQSSLLACETLNQLDRLVSNSDPFDYGVHDQQGPQPLLETTAKELNLELLYFCLRLDGEDKLKQYWRIERKRGLKKIDVWNKEQTFFKRLINNGNNGKCYKNYMKKEEERRALKDENRTEFESQMSPKTVSVYKKINKIRDNLQLTIDQEIQQIKRLERALDANTRAELFRIVPELHRYYNAGTYSYL